GSTPICKTLTSFCKCSSLTKVMSWKCMKSRVASTRLPSMTKAASRQLPPRKHSKACFNGRVLRRKNVVNLDHLSLNEYARHNLRESVATLYDFRYNNVRFIPDKASPLAKPESVGMIR